MHTRSTFVPATGKETSKASILSVWLVSVDNP